TMERNIYSIFACKKKWERSIVATLLSGKDTIRFTPGRKSALIVAVPVVLIAIGTATYLISQRGGQRDVRPVQSPPVAPGAPSAGPEASVAATQADAGHFLAPPGGCSEVMVTTVGPDHYKVESTQQVGTDGY